jgi:myo-inositol-1(or 4)-monophosphatase
VANEYFESMMTIARQAGKIAMDLVDDSSPSLKPDRSVLTKADLAISALTRRQLKDYLATADHILLDEEDKDHDRYFNQSLLESKRYMWILDPVDGTRSFANRLPMWGISLGLLKDGKPWLGVVYFPMLKELFYCDGRQTCFVKNAFSKNQKITKIKPIDQEITRQSIFFATDAFFRYFQWDYSFCTIMMCSCAVVDLCWPAIGRGCGEIFRSNLWDFAGSWPIFQGAGLQLRNYHTGKVLDRVNTSVFVGEEGRTWKLKDFYVLSSERNFPILKAKISLLPAAS